MVKKIIELRKMAAVLKDAELVPSHEKAELYTDIQSNSWDIVKGEWTASPQQTREPECEWAGKPRELSGNSGNAPGSKALVSAIIYIPPYLNRAGGNFTRVLWCTCKFTSMCSWPHCLNPFQLITKGTSRINSTLPHAPGLPVQSCYSLVGQCPRCHTCPPSSNLSAKTTQHTQPT